MTRSVKLFGLDFGTTTSSAVVASADLVQNAVSGRSELSQLRECYRSEMIFTPLLGEGLDLDRLETHLDEWLSASGVRPDEIFGGGALLTGLTAQKENADGLVRLVERRLGDALIAAADDPCFESWLAFMGSCAGLSRSHPDTPIINLDIGGGTTNFALGLNGEVRRVGCLFVGARHVQVEPGTYRIVKLSSDATQLFAELGIQKTVGDSLTPAEVDRVLDFYLTLLIASVSGDAEPFKKPVARLHQQVPFRLPPLGAAPVVTFSGGVGELVYSHLSGRPWPTTTYYGDLGIDLAQRLIGVREWADHLRSFVPAGGGRATVYGLLRHSTQVSGNTLFLPNPDLLPLRNLPIFGAISPLSTDEEIRHGLELVRRSGQGGCLSVRLSLEDDSRVRELGGRMARLLRDGAFPMTKPLVLLVDRNLGKALGHCVTDWGRLACNVVVIDEIEFRNAQFLQIGRLQNQVVPVSFHGMNESAYGSERLV